MPEAAGLHYEVDGAADAPPLVLSSGLGGLGDYWAPNLPALAEHFRVIRYDHRGTGRSRNGAPAEVSVAAMAADVADLLDALGIARANFIGHALGGAIGLEVAARSGRIDRLVVVNGWRTLSPHTRRCFGARLALLHGSGPRAYLEAQPLFLYPPAWIAGHDAELLADLAHQLAAFPDAGMVARRIAAVQAYTPDPAAIAMLPGLLAVGTRDDFLVPCATALDLAVGVPGAQSVLLEWGGHACNVTDPVRFNDVALDFLRR